MANAENSEIIITDADTHIAQNKTDKTKNWKGKFILTNSSKGINVNISENIIYFRYAYMQTWFGPYFAISCLFSDQFVNVNKEILDKHDFINITFTDNTGTMTLKGIQKFNSLTYKTIPNQKEGNQSVLLWISIYYPEILVNIDKEPKIQIPSLDLSFSSIKTICDGVSVKNIQKTKSISDKASEIIFKTNKATIKNKSSREALLSVLFNLSINDKVQSEFLSFNTKTGVNKYDKRIMSMIDSGDIYPVRMGTDVLGNTLYFNYYKDLMDDVNDKATLTCTFTDSSIDRNTIEKNTKINGNILICTHPITYSLNNNFDFYISNSDKISIEIDYTYVSTKLKRTVKLDKILTINNFFNPNKFTIRNTDLDNVPKVIKYSTTYYDRQRCSSILMNNFYQNVNFVFTTCDGLLPIKFFKYKNGNLIWSLVKVIHVALLNKIENKAGPEIIEFNSQLTGIIMEASTKTGKPGILEMTQKISLASPKLFKHG